MQGQHARRAPDAVAAFATLLICIPGFWLGTMIVIYPAVAAVSTPIRGASV